MVENCWDKIRPAKDQPPDCIQSKKAWKGSVKTCQQKVITTCPFVLFTMHLTLVRTSMLALMTFQLTTELCIIEFCFLEQCGHSSCCFALDSRLVDCRLAFETVQVGNHVKVELTEPHPRSFHLIHLLQQWFSGKCIHPPQKKTVTTRSGYCWWKKSCTTWDV